MSEYRVIAYRGEERYQGDYKTYGGAQIAVEALRCGGYAATITLLSPHLEHPGDAKAQEGGKT